MENNKTHNSLLLTGSFSCWRKWCTKSKFFTLPLFFTKNSRTEAWVIPSFADMLNLCGKVQISPPLLSDRHYFPPSSQLCSNACWELVKSSRACSTWLSTSGRERACVWSWEEPSVTITTTVQRLLLRLRCDESAKMKLSFRAKELHLPVLQRLKYVLTHHSKG